MDGFASRRVPPLEALNGWNQPISIAETWHRSKSAQIQFADGGCFSPLALVRLNSASPTTDYGSATSISMSKLATPTTLAELVEAIETLLHEEPDVPLKEKLKIQQLLEAYPVNMHELKPFAQFDSSRNYTRNLISTDHEHYALILLCWNRGKYSPIHDHPTDGCWVKAIQGHVNEVRYVRDGACLVETSNITLTEGVTYMDDSFGLHKVGNPREDGEAITLHLYAPPYDKCRIWFDPEDADKSSVAVSTYFSEYGDKIEY